MNDHKKDINEFMSELSDRKSKDMEEVIESIKFNKPPSDDTICLLDENPDLFSHLCECISAAYDVGFETGGGIVMDKFRSLMRPKETNLYKN